MKKILLGISLLFSIKQQAQSTKTLKLLDDIKNEWSVDDNGNVTYIRIIETGDLSKDEVYNRAQAYFTYKYNDGDSVMQINEKSNGVIVGKGLYKKVYTGSGFMDVISTDVWHILRIDIKEGKARILLTMSEYITNQTICDLKGNCTTNKRQSVISSQYPINPKGSRKTIMGKTFVELNKLAKVSLDGIEKAVKEGNTSKQLENSNW